MSVLARADLAINSQWMSFVIPFFLYNVLFCWCCIGMFLGNQLVAGLHIYNCMVRKAFVVVVIDCLLNVIAYPIQYYVSPTMFEPNLACRNFK